MATATATGASVRDDLLALSRAIHSDPEVEIAESMRLYAPTKPHPRLTALLGEELRSRGIELAAAEIVMASTDFGNVSHVVAADYVGFPVSAERIGGHNIAMREASISDLAHRNAMTVVDVLASAAVRIATDARLRSDLKRER